MSTFVYAKLTNAREVAAPGTSTTTESPGLNTYVDAFAALVPSEVLTLHAVIIANTTRTDPAAAGGTTTTILPDALLTLNVAFWALLLASIALYAVPRYSGGNWDRWDWVRAAIAPLAFVGWTMLQRATAFDAAFPQLTQSPRTVTALFLGAILGAVTAWMASMADQKA